jgi:hypothetical protein
MYLLASFASVMLMAQSALHAATLVLSGSPPTPGTNDIYNFTGASRDSLNVGDGSANAEGHRRTGSSDRTNYDCW